MSRLVEKYFKAIELRKRGYSIREISTILKISKSTASLWLRDVKIPEERLKRLKRQKMLSRIKAANTRRNRKEKEMGDLRKEIKEELKNIKFSRRHLRLMCALLFYCEGGKDVRAGIEFVNSDPKLIQTFLKLLRQSFNLKEEKFRVVLHLHKYHSPRKQILFWSKITNIPVNQFSRPYLKLNTGKRIREGYPGCANVKYYDSKLGQRLLVLAQEFLRSYNKGA